MSLEGAWSRRWTFQSSGNFEGDSNGVDRMRLMTLIDIGGCESGTLRLRDQVLGHNV